MAANQVSCDLCPDGKYQDVPGQTACRLCLSGRYCEVGTAKPTPCPAGTYSNATGLLFESQCVPVAEGFWAPIGSSEPEYCPSTGFFCPGRANDKDNKVPGSLPIEIPQGQMTSEVEVVETQMELDMDCDGQRLFVGQADVENCFWQVSLPGNSTQNSVCFDFLETRNPRWKPSLV